MKKILFVIITVFIAILVYVNVNADEDFIVIPEAAIRVRVIAHSNSIHDQNMKMKVKKYIEETLSPKLVDVADIEEARRIIQENIDIMNLDIQNLFSAEKYDQNFTIYLGNHYFPEKDYKGVHYDTGSYESLVVTIGAGEGDNWWCVLFPPLCLLDASANETGDVEYQFFVTKMLEKIFE